jgi:sulfite exporter TauE/SafE
MILYLGNKKVKLSLADGKTYNLTFGSGTGASLLSVSVLENLLVNALENKTISEVEA